MMMRTMKKATRESRISHRAIHHVTQKRDLQTYPVEELLCGNTTLYSIGMGMLIICLANNIGTDVAKFISDYKKENEIDGMRVVFKDGCFGGNDSLKTNIKEILKVAGVEEFITI